MNNTLNITDNNNLITVSLETGEVIEKSVQSENTEKECVTAVHAEENAAAQDKADAENKSEAQGGAKFITFNPRSFKANKEAAKTAAIRSFISNPVGSGLVEAYTIGNWNWDWSQIDSTDMVLEKNTDYEFVFWLNGGENDQQVETCRLDIIFDNDRENQYTYNLNRGFIRYEKYYKGWYLYRIPFNTGDACYTKFSFVSMRAFTTIIKAETVENCMKLPDDFPPEGVPQRHNIVFTNGFPRNSWWSYKVFDDIPDPNTRSTDTAKASNTMGVDVDMIMDNLRGRIEDELDHLIDEIVDEFDVDSVKERIIQQVKDSMNL